MSIEDAFAPGDAYDDNQSLTNREGLDAATGTAADGVDTAAGMSVADMASELAEFFTERDQGYETPVIEEIEADRDVDAEVDLRPDNDQTVFDPDEQPLPVQEPDTYSINGRDISREEANQLLALYDWAATLPPESAQAINDVLSGQYYLAPVDSTPSAPAPTAASGSGPSPATFTPGVAGVGQTSVPAIDPNRFVDPELAQYVQQVTDQQNALIAQQSQQLADYQAQQAQLAAYQAQQEQDRLMQQVQVGQNTFSEQHPDFTPQDIDALVNQVATLQIVPSLMKKHAGNAAAAMSEAMETALWATPQFRDRAIQSQIDQFAQTTEQTAQKKRKASALSGSSGSVARTAPDARPMTKAEREQAMIREVANAMNGAEG